MLLGSGSRWGFVVGVTTNHRVLEDRVYFIIGQPREQRAAPEDLPSFWCRPDHLATSQNDRRWRG
jgi:hypothetical protein